MCIRDRLKIIKKPNSQLGIWSKRSERNKALRESRLNKNDSLRATRLSDMKLRQEKMRERMKNRFEGSPKKDQIHLESDSGKVSVQLFPKDSNVEPLYILQGKEVTKDAIKGLLSDDIETVNVLKGETARVTYGEKGRNGAVVVTLKN